MFGWQRCKSLIRTYTIASFVVLFAVFFVFGQAPAQQQDAEKKAQQPQQSQELQKAKQKRTKYGQKLQKIQNATLKKNPDVKKELEKRLSKLRKLQKKKFKEIVIYKFILISLTVVMFLIVGANVFSRFVLNNSLGWADELSRFIFIWISFLGAVIAYGSDDHVGLNFVIAKIPSAKIQNLINIITDILIMLVLAIITYYGYIVATSATNVSPALYIPMTLVYSVVPFSGLIMMMINLTKIKKHIELFIKDKKEKYEMIDESGGAQ